MQKVSSSKSVSGVPVRPTLANSSSLFLISSRLATYIRLSSFTVKWVRSWARSGRANNRAGQIESQRLAWMPATPPRNSTLKSDQRSWWGLKISLRASRDTVHFFGLRALPCCAGCPVMKAVPQFLIAPFWSDNIAQGELRIAKTYLGHCLLAYHSYNISRC